MRSDDVYWLALHSVPNIGPASYRALLGTFGSPRAALEAVSDDLLHVPHISKQMATEIAALGDRLDYFITLLRGLEEKGISLLRESDEGYPQPLVDILRHPPPVLWTIGRWRESDRRSVAIVGTRKPTREALEWAHDLAAELAGRGCTVVSGNAEGIDAAAHRGAIDAGGRTIMVVPLGINRFRPARALRGLGYDRDQVLVISPFYPDQQWMTAAAMARNRIIAALSQAVVVGELGSTSGSVSTARAAAGFDIPVFVFRRPGQPNREKRNAVLYRLGAQGLDSTHAAETVLEKMQPGRRVERAKDVQLTLFEE